MHTKTTTANEIQNSNEERPNDDEEDTRNKCTEHESEVITKMHRRFSIGDVYNDYDFRAERRFITGNYDYLLFPYNYCSVYFTQNIVFSLIFTFVESIRPSDCERVHTISACSASCRGRVRTRLFTL